MPLCGTTPSWPARSACVTTRWTRSRTKIFRELLTYMITDSSTIKRCIDLILISRNFERIGDHATNIAEDVIFMVKGQDIRHQKLGFDFGGIIHKGNQVERFSHSVNFFVVHGASRFDVVFYLVLRPLDNVAPDDIVAEKCAQRPESDYHEEKRQKKACPQA